MLGLDTPVLLVIKDSDGQVGKCLCGGRGPIKKVFEEHKGIADTLAHHGRQNCVYQAVFPLGNYVDAFKNMFHCQAIL